MELMLMQLDLSDAHGTAVVTYMPATIMPVIGGYITLQGKHPDGSPANRFHKVLNITTSYNSEGWQGCWQEGKVFVDVGPALTYREYFLQVFGVSPPENKSE